MIKERLETDLKNALKKGEGDVVTTIRFLLAQIQSEEIKSRGQGGSDKLSDEVVLSVIQGEAKKRNEAIEMFKSGGRSDLVSQEEKAMATIKVYLPPELGRNEIVAVVKRLQKTGLKDFNVLMKQAMSELKGRAGGKEVGEIVREVLNG